MTHDHRSSLTVAAALALALLASTGASAQQGRTDGQTGQVSPSAPSMQGSQAGSMSQGRMALSQSQVRGFYDQMEQTLRQAVRNREPRQAAQFMRRHLSENATFVSSNSVSLDGRQIATSVVTLDDDALSDILGFASNAMQSGGRRNISNYRLEIDVRDIQPVRGENAVRVRAVLREQGQLRMSQDGVAGTSQDRQQQSRAGDQDDSSMRMRDMMRDNQRRSDADQPGDMRRDGGSRAIGASTLHFQVAANCEQMLRPGADNQIEIGNTVCRATTEIER